ncbi:hypothetical protein DAH66_09755 [Sphingomonas koreensis]|uniref:Uncharacterized protein n=1 Tax=Sphingomonas koreensis TaxID=93064 RepID=A0A430G491_9SPHN|nr:hypothetical protein [Sphingomonas koreensis]RSY85968.1 hypothetical protein DAH66_09755 [Sphingomonas koreensis]
MGVDFIREQSGKPWRKRWNKSLDRLKLPGLFDVEFASQQRTVNADIDGGSSLQIGDQLVVQCNDRSAIICRGHHRVGEIPSIPADMIHAISSCGGVALGVVERISMFGNNAELSIR